MRREGFEMAVAKPRVVYKEDQRRNASRIENLSIDLEERHQGAIMEEIGRRRGELTNMEPDGHGPYPPRIPHSGARPDRLPVRLHDHDPRHRPDQPRLRRLRSGQGRTCRAATTAC
jgi:hypothetical protein